MLLALTPDAGSALHVGVTGVPGVGKSTAIEALGTYLIDRGHRVAVLAAYHEAGEVFTGDLPTPIKYFNPEIKQAYVAIEDFAKGRLQRMLPQELQPSFQPLLFPHPAEQELWRIVKAADKICAYLKCVEELKTGNQEFAKAERTIRQELDQFELPEVRYFMEHFAPSFGLALDELN